MSWESTLGYYRQINLGINKALGGLHSAKIAMYSVDFEPVETMQHKGDWQGTAKILAEGAKKIQVAGADFLVICTNTMHKVARKSRPQFRSPCCILPIEKADPLRIIDALAARGAEAIILGCTEIGMLVKQTDTGVRVFDTTTIHAARRWNTPYSPPRKPPTLSRVSGVSPQGHEASLSI